MKNIFIVFIAFSLLVGFVFAQFEECQTDEDCMNANKGNVCGDGYCMYVDQASCETDENCAQFESCYGGICQFDSLKYHSCKTDIECQERNIGNACISGICENAGQPDNFVCFPGIFMALFAGFAIMRK